MVERGKSLLPFESKIALLWSKLYKVSYLLSDSWVSRMSIFLDWIFIVGTIDSFWHRKCWKWRHHRGNSDMVTRLSFSWSNAIFPVGRWCGTIQNFIWKSLLATITNWAYGVALRINALLLSWQYSHYEVTKNIVSNNCLKFLKNSVIMKYLESPKM